MSIYLYSFFKFRYQILKRAVFCLRFQLALPYLNDIPSKFGKLRIGLFISLNITFNFILPKFAICFRNSWILTVLVSVPKAPVNEYNSLVFRKDDVRFPGKIFSMKSETKPVSKQKATHQNFGFGVLASYVRHTFAALFFWEYISHYKQENFQVGRQATKPFTTTRKFL